jgi:putative radical SAM enzyme (TIGR03279 family)
LKAGDFVVSCDGEPIDDWIDFARAASGMGLELTYRRGTVSRRVRLRRAAGRGWGISLEGSAPRPCRNRCVFCFMDQMPPGLRPSLYLKDDDVRHSFVHGSYVTLDDSQVEFALSRRLSPIHVSVHSTDPGMRGALLGLGRPAPILPSLEELRRGGVEAEVQIVVVPGWNDGRALSSTLSDLREEPCVISVGVVPVGLTRHRQGLPLLRRPTREEASDCISICSAFREESAERSGDPWAWPADEMFLLAGIPLPPASWYEGCTLQANGIGLLSAMMAIEGREFRGAGTVVTGALAAPFFRRLLSGSGYEVAEAPNSMFGEEVGVAGLLSGADVIRASALSRGDGPLFLPATMFSSSGVTLDDLTPEMLAGETGRDVRVACFAGDLP